MQLQGDRISLTDAGKRLVQASRSKSWHDEQEKIEAALRADPPPDEAAGEELPPGAYERALSAYLARWGS